MALILSPVIKQALTDAEKKVTGPSQRWDVGSGDPRITPAFFMIDLSSGMSHLCGLTVMQMRDETLVPPQEREGHDLL